MKEVDLVQAVASWINLSYAAGQWWITVTTALLVATYFAARQIPPWFFAIILLLYLLSAVSVLIETTEYDRMAGDYGLRLFAFRAASHDPVASSPVLTKFGALNGLILYAVYALGSFSAATYSFIHWRNTRKA